MPTGNVEHVIKNSILYTYAFSQPFTTYIAAYPIQQDQILIESNPVHYGESGEIVRLIQLKLNNLGYYDDLIDGDFGLLTEYALKAFQSSHNITITGSTNEQTMKQLIETEKNEYLAQIADIIPNINYGMVNDNVSDVQEVLYYLGYYEGNIDGIYGPLTEQAIEKVSAEGLFEFTETYDVEAISVNSSEPSVNEQTNDEDQAIDVIQLEVKQTNPNVIQEARSHIGTPYVWGGQSPSGFDCSGFIQFVYGEQNMTIPRTANEIWNFSSPIDSPSVGDLVFFETYQPGPSHLGIYLGNGDFIHAGSSRGVEISHMENAYWSEKYIGAKRIN